MADALELSLRNGVVAQKLILVDSAGIKPKRSAQYYLKVYSYKAMKKALSLPGLAQEKG